MTNLSILISIKVLCFLVVPASVIANGDHTEIDNMCYHGWNCPRASFNACVSSPTNPVDDDYVCPGGNTTYTDSELYANWIRGYYAFQMHVGISTDPVQSASRSGRSSSQNRVTTGSNDADIDLRSVTHADVSHDSRLFNLVTEMYCNFPSDHDEYLTHCPKNVRYALCLVRGHTWDWDNSICVQ